MPAFQTEQAEELIAVHARGQVQRDIVDEFVIPSTSNKVVPDGVRRTRNPFAPGPGTRPPVFSGREVERRRPGAIVEDLNARCAGPIHLLQAPRGMGKTVLLRDLQQTAPEIVHWMTGADLSDLPCLARELANAVDRLVLDISTATIGVLRVDRRGSARRTVDRECLAAARLRVDAVRADFYSHRYDEFEHPARRDGIPRDAMLAAVQAVAVQFDAPGAAIRTAALNRLWIRPASRPTMPPWREESSLATAS